MATTGKVAGVNPKNFKIIKGKLYLNWSADGSDQFADNSDDYIQKADENWATLNDKN